MITSLYRKDAACIWEFPFLDIFHPRAIYSDRKIMLLLASDSTGVTSDAFPVVDDEPKFCHAFRIIDLNGKETKNILNI